MAAWCESFIVSFVGGWCCGEGAMSRGRIRRPLNRDKASQSRDHRSPMESKATELTYKSRQSEHKSNGSDNGERIVKCHGIITFCLS